MESFPAETLFPLKVVPLIEVLLYDNRMQFRDPVEDNHIFTRSASSGPLCLGAEGERLEQCPLPIFKTNLLMRKVQILNL
jgi:hypothetical protein